MPFKYLHQAVHQAITRKKQQQQQQQQFMLQQKAGIATLSFEEHVQIGDDEYPRIRPHSMSTNSVSSIQSSPPPLHACSPLSTIIGNDEESRPDIASVNHDADMDCANIKLENSPCYFTQQINQYPSSDSGNQQFEFMRQSLLPHLHELNLPSPADVSSSLTGITSPIPIPASPSFGHMGPKYENYHQEQVPSMMVSPCTWKSLLDSRHPVLVDDGSDAELNYGLKKYYGADADRMTESLKFLAVVLKSSGNTLMERLVEPREHHHEDFLLLGSSHHNHSLQLINVLGCGSFGIVLRCRWLATGELVALKVIDKRLIHLSQYTRRGHLTEVAIMQELMDEEYQSSKVTHKTGIPRVLEAWEDDFAWFVVMEYGGYPWMSLIKSDELSPREVAEKRAEISNELISLASVTGMGTVVEQLAGISLGQSQESNLKQNGLNRDWLQDVDCLHRQLHLNLPLDLAIPLAPIDHHLGALIRALGGYSVNTINQTGRVMSPPCRPPVIPLEVQLTILHAVLLALNCLHTHGLCHRDIKCENVLVDRQLKNIQLIDYGHAAAYRCAETPSAPVFTQYGTHLFNPPEIRWPEYRPTGSKYQTGRYRGPEADVYALGLMCYEMTHGDLPPELFRTPVYPLAVDGVTTIQNGNLGMKFWDVGGIRISPERGFTNTVYGDMIRRMLCVDPRQRPSVVVLLSMVETLSQTCVNKFDDHLRGKSHCLPMLAASQHH